MAARTGRWDGRGLMDQGPAGDGRTRVASSGNDTKYVCVSVTQCMSLPLSVIALNSVVDIVNVSITFSGSFILGMVCMCSLCVYFLYCKRLQVESPPLFLGKLYPISKAFPTFPSKARKNYGDSALLLRPYYPSPNLEVPPTPGPLSPCFSLGFRTVANIDSEVVVPHDTRRNEGG